VDRWQAAFQPKGGAQFSQREIGFFGQLRTERAMVLSELRFATGTVMLRSKIAEAAPLLQELLHHAERDAVALRNVRSRAFVIVIRGQDPFPQV
jgi:hypothetical protein